jgi:hypothetical protein
MTPLPIASNRAVLLPLAGIEPGQHVLQVHGRSGNDRDRRAIRSLIVRVK